MVLVTTQDGSASLKYYTDEKKTLQDGECDIDSKSKVEIRSSEPGKGFHFVLTTSAIILNIITDTEADRSKWIATIQNIITRLLSAPVFDLSPPTVALANLSLNEASESPASSVNADVAASAAFTRESPSGNLTTEGMSDTTKSSTTKNDEVFLKLRQFLDCKQAITQTWAAISSGQLELIPTRDTVQNPDESWNFALRQQNLAGVSVESIQELYEAAETASPVFAQLIEKVVIAAGLPVDCIHMAPLKGIVRATEKAKDDYNEREPGHGERWLFDIVRGAALCETEEQLTRLMEALRSQPEIDIVRLKNRFASPTPSGFRDFNLNIRVPINERVFHICELQVHCAAIKKMDEVKLSHKIYEYFRTYFRGEAKSVDERLKVLEQVAGSLGSAAGVTSSSLEAIVESALASSNLEELENVSALLDLLFEYEHNIRICRQIVIVAEEYLGPEDSFTLDRARILGTLLADIGEMAEARALHERTMWSYEKTLGPEHPGTLAVVNCLAIVLQSLGESTEARALFERVLRGQENVLGPEHASTLATVHTLEPCFRIWGKWPKREQWMSGPS